MALFGKKKRDVSTPDMGMFPGQGADQYADYGQEYGYGQEAYPPGYGPEQYPPPGQPPPQGMAAPPVPEVDKGRIEEVAEAIVEEKWREKVEEINKINQWKDDVTSRLAQLQQQIDDLKGAFDSLQKGMFGKISEYDENLTNVGTEIKAMEKVFSKVLPTLTDSVNKLQRMSGGVRKK